MRILYHHRTQGEEPESVHIIGIVTSLRREGCDVELEGPVRLGQLSRRGGPSRLGAIKGRLPRPVLELAQIVFNLPSFAQLCRALLFRRYDLVYERYALYNVAGLLAARLFRRPFFLEVNTPYAQAWAKYYGIRFPRLARAVERWTFRHADHVFTVTEVQRDVLRSEGVRPERISVCHNAIDPDEFNVDRSRIEPLRAELGLRAVVVGFVGTMNRWQGIQGFAEVVREVAAVRDDVSFLFVGDGEARPQLQETLKTLGLMDRAVFVGRRPHDEVPRYLALMDVGVLLDSNAYGSPMKIFEYWAMAKAVVAPRVAPVLEILSDGVNGLLIEPADAQGMARAIVRIAEDPSLGRNLGCAGRNLVIERYTWQVNARAILLAYQHWRGGRRPVSERAEP